MPIRRSSAARLCTRAELELVDASRATEARRLSPARLRQKIERSRRLRDKYRDLARRQRREARGKQPSSRRARPAQAQRNTERKAELFEEVLQRFQNALAHVTAPGRRGTGKRGTAKRDRRRPAAGASEGPAGGRAKPAAPLKPGPAAMKGGRQRPATGEPLDAYQRAAGRTVNARTRSTTRRNQLRRDQRE